MQETDVPVSTNGQGLSSDNGWVTDAAKKPHSGMHPRGRGLAMATAGAAALTVLGGLAARNAEAEYQSLSQDGLPISCEIYLQETGNQPMDWNQVPYACTSQLQAHGEKVTDAESAVRTWTYTAVGSGTATAIMGTVLWRRRQSERTSHSASSVEVAVPAVKCSTCSQPVTTPFCAACGDRVF